MSRTMRRHLVLTALGVLAPQPVAAQQTEAGLRAHIDTLLPLVEQSRQDVARALAERGQRVAKSTRGLDTIRVAGAAVVATRRDARLARTLFEESWAEHFSLVEGDALRGWTFTFQALGRGEEARALSSGRPLGRNIEISAWETRARAERHVRSALSDAVAHELQATGIGAWGGADALRDRDLARTYRGMATAAARSVRSCLAGDTRACVQSLGLDIGDDAMSVWYAPAERRRLVLETHFHPANVSGDLYAACVEGIDDQACDEVIGDRRWPPLDARVRGSVVRYALERGGEGAWMRLLESTETSPEEALAYVSGMELNELIAEWRAWLLENRPVSYAGLGGKSALALLWILIFTTLATRSTRWRLG